MTATDKKPSLHGHVVIGYDGSRHAERALEFAVEEAVRRRTGLQLLCGVPWPPPASAGLGLSPAEHSERERVTRELLDEAAERARKLAAGELDVVTTVTRDPAVEALVHHGRTAALTVVGTRGHGGFAGLLLGSVSQRVAAHTHMPLAVVRGDADGTGEHADTVLVGVRSNSETAAVRYGFEEAARRGARLHVLHAWSYAPFTGTLTRPDSPRSHEETAEARKAAEALPRYAVAPVRDEFPEVEVTTDHECRSPSAALVERTKSVERVVVTVHRHTHPFGRRLGPVTHALLHHAHCPVILVPGT
ncbi:universal stress protein [Streptomyces sp. WMMC500]|uniref:universal stress protein n=1 Tax=Streptomyces sp. WMMC500 TaxID=3015154 RepID=UPI00248C26DE|nr:universal stress protein [Streptomyces sp. WMMC500]WBB61940.1 universal stress protein [Streptomyces sp. WMMC500]